MVEIRNIQVASVAAADLDLHLIHKAYFPPGRLAKGDRVLFETEGKLVMVSDPVPPPQVMQITVKLDAGTALEQTVLTLGDSAALAQSPIWVQWSQGFVVGSDGFLYSSVFPIVNGEAAHADLWNTDLRRAATIGAETIAAPLQPGIGGAGVSAAAFDLTIAHRLTAYVSFLSIVPDNILTVLTARTIIRQPMNGNTAGE